MPRIWIGNFDLETTLAGENPSGELERLSAEWTFAFLPVVEAGDIIAAPGEIAFDPAFVHELQRKLKLPEFVVRRLTDLPLDGSERELVPWGWTPAMLALARRHDYRTACPEIDVIRSVHVRDYSIQLAEELGVPLAEARRLESIDELGRIVNRLSSDQRWVIKSRWGASGRGQLRRRGNALSEQDARWAARLLRRDGVLFWEPWLHSLGEAGMQFEVPRCGPPRLVAVVPGFMDHQGQYAGSVVPVENDSQLANDWSEAVSVGIEVCGRMQSAGYFGPVGIDAMRYADEAGTPRLRPIQEINARWTMGRLAAAWRRYLPASARAVWVQEQIDSGELAIHHRVATTPASINGQACTRRMELRWE